MAEQMLTDYEWAAVGEEITAAARKIEQVHTCPTCRVQKQPVDVQALLDDDRWFIAFSEHKNKIT